MVTPLIVDRKIHWGKHILAFFITALVFIVGVLIGLRLTELRIGYSQDLWEKQRTDAESLQLQLIFLAAQQNKSCSVLLRSLESNAEDLENARVKLETFIGSGGAEDYAIVKNNYMLTEIRYWLLARDTRQVCENDKVHVLFFYESDDVCGDCSAQGYVLTYLKNLFADQLLIFSLDAGFEEPMIQILKDNYGITEFPALVVEDKVFQGLTVKETLISEICGLYKKPPDACLLGTEGALRKGG